MVHRDVHAVAPSAFSDRPSTAPAPRAGPARGARCAPSRAAGCARPAEARIGLIARADPSKRRGRPDPAAAAQVLEGVDVEHHRRAPGSASAPVPQRSSAPRPAAAASAARQHGDTPSPCPATASRRPRPGPAPAGAASRADSHRADISDEMWTDTIARRHRRPPRPRRPRGTPAATAATCVTGVNARSAAATSRGGDVDALAELAPADDDVERHDARCRAGSTTDRRQVCRRVSDDRDAHLAQATGRRRCRPAASRRDDVDELRRAHDDGADAALGRRRRPCAAPAPARAASSSLMSAAHLDPVAHLALDLHDAGDRVLDEQRRVGHAGTART